MLGVTLSPRKNSRRLACLANAPDSVLDDGFKIGIRRLACITKRPMQIARADEQPVDTVYRCDPLEIVQGCLRLDLHQHTDLFVSVLGIILDPAKTRSSSDGRDAAQAV